ncbi:proline dehydrogenase family protein [Nigerium massiliense]|uniref:proline dehydrogenase family protein n=1 Tax=Nigerium massiliense TaxID=1522317 RepID=UPI001F1F51D3|nr:proline dehydrogenase family protein [Nigerium massiliense]
MADSNLIKSMVTGFPLTRSVVDRFVAGETLDECLVRVRELADAGLLATIDRLGEDTTNRQQAEETADAYVELIERLHAEGLTDRVEVSLKLSAIGQFLPEGRELALANALRICQAAADAGTTVTFDMEDHTTTSSTLGLLAEVRERFPQTGAVIQAYLRRTRDDTRDLATEGSRVRLCKGAYEQPASVAYKTAEEIDRSYVDCLRILMEGPGYPMVATHDPAMISTALSLANVTRRAVDSYEFQMLFNIRPDEQRRLSELGHQVRVYVPYGTDWYGYFMRRLAERPANLFFFLRALVGRR